MTVTVEKGWLRAVPKDRERRAIPSPRKCGLLPRRLGALAKTQAQKIAADIIIRAIFALFVRCTRIPRLSTRM